MEVKIEIPDDVKRRLERDWGDVSRHALERLAIEGYSLGVLSRAQVRRMLGFETRTEVDEFMARHGVPFDYTVEDFELDAGTSRHLRGTRRKELQRR
jgi:predicted HTH domain antitoxin